MSGLIFSLMLGAAAIAALTRALREERRFEELFQGQGWRGYVKEDGYNVEVFIKRDKEQIRFILPDRSIPEEVCKRAVKKLTAKLYATIYGEKPSPDSIIMVGSAYSFCHYCLEPARELLFRCKRCGGLYCSRHRLPEEHNCPGGGVVKIRIKRREREKKEEEKARKIILKEVPCG
jgi:hypothetical protein